MKCPNCGQQMEKGTLSLMTIQGWGQIMISFTSEKNENKKFLKKQTKDKIILSGEEAKAYFCACCKGIMTFMELE